MVAVKGEVIVVSPRSTVRRRFCFGVKVVYRGSDEECPSPPSDFGGSADPGDLCGTLFDEESDNIFEDGHPNGNGERQTYISSCSTYYFQL